MSKEININADELLIECYTMLLVQKSNILAIKSMLKALTKHVIKDDEIANKLINVFEAQISELIEKTKQNDPIFKSVLNASIVNELKDIKGIDFDSLMG
jgi:ribosomal protein L9